MRFRLSVIALLLGTYGCFEMYRDFNKADENYFDFPVRSIRIGESWRSTVETALSSAHAPARARSYFDTHNGCTEPTARATLRVLPPRYAMVTLAPSEAA